VRILFLIIDGEVIFTIFKGWVSNTALVAIAAISIVLLVAAVPLQLLGGG
jgi:hypothetical protein